MIDLHRNLIGSCKVIGEKIPDGIYVIYKPANQSLATIVLAWSEVVPAMWLISTDLDRKEISWLVTEPFHSKADFEPWNHLIRSSACSPYTGCDYRAIDTDEYCGHSEMDKCDSVCFSPLRHVTVHNERKWSTMQVALLWFQRVNWQRTKVKIFVTVSTFSC